MGEQDRGGLEPVLAQHLRELVEDLDARVDDDALLRRAGGHHVAVGAEDGAGKADDLHVARVSARDRVVTAPGTRLSPSPGHALYTGEPSTHEPISEEPRRDQGT